VSISGETVNMRGISQGGMLKILIWKHLPMLRYNNYYQYWNCQNIEV